MDLPPLRTLRNVFGLLPPGHGIPETFTTLGAQCVFRFLWTVAVPCSGCNGCNGFIGALRGRPSRLRKQPLFLYYLSCINSWLL
jgi:hypothetical protein